MGGSTPKAGRVVAVCRRSTAGIPKIPKREIRVVADGIEGDFHAGPTRRSRRTGRLKENDRQISLVAKEAIEAIGEAIGVAIPPGGFGENILVEGLGDLSRLSAGDRIWFEGGVVVEVTEQNEPCAALKIWHKRIVKESIGRRGIVGVVKKEGVVRPGDRVVLKSRRRTTRVRKPKAKRVI